MKIGIIGILFFCVFSCKTPKSKCRVDGCRDTLVVVLCDVTRSVDATVYDNVRKTAVDIFDKFTDNTQFTYFIINDADYNRSVYSYHKHELLDAADFEEDEELGKRMKARDSLIMALAFDSAKYRYQNTSITMAINTAYEYIQDFAKAYPGVVLKMVILSDMIEDTDESTADNRFGVVSMVNRSNVQSLISELEKTVVQDNNHNLQNLGVKTYIVFESENLVSENRNLQTSASREELKRLWGIMFRAFGYQKGSDSLVFSFLELPENIK